VFDCRSLPNPGRYAEYSDVTGRDASVIDYLEKAPEVEKFWNHVLPLVDAHVDSFRERDFTHLSIAFGCTGGQHRSVYFAERLARHVRARHPDVVVQVEHQQAPRWPALRAVSGSDLGAPPRLAPPSAQPDEIEPWTR
jgi:RNase adaptor protein for sRNA GlmZ degradation